MHDHTPGSIASAPEFWLNEIHVIPDRGLVVRGDREARLERKVMAVLVCLAEHHGEVVTHRDLISRVWGPGGATADLVSRAVGLVRRAIGGSPGSPVIETIRGTGYCLVATVSEDRPALRDPVGRPRRVARLSPILTGSLSFAATAALWFAACLVIGWV